MLGCNTSIVNLHLPESLLKNSIDFRCYKCYNNNIEQTEIALRIALDPEKPGSFGFKKDKARFVERYFERTPRKITELVYAPVLLRMILGRVRDYKRKIKY